MDFVNHDPRFKKVLEGIFTDHRITRGVFKGQAMAISEEGGFSVFKASDVNADIVIA